MTALQTQPSPLIIAEIGVNHDGKLARAMELVEIARQAGADAVKLQIFTAASLMNQQARFAEYQQERCSDESPAAMLRRYELKPLELVAIVQQIRLAGMMPLATPFSLTDVEVIGQLNLPMVKIASPDLVNRPLLQAVARLGKPMLVSTGAAEIAEVEMATGWLNEWQVQYTLLHCVSSYPVPAEQLHLGWIGQLSRQFDVPVGYSDHSTQVISGALAVAAGASVLERHLTYDCKASGPDHAASSDGPQFAQYVQLARQAAIMRGQGGKSVLAIERDVRSVSRQSLVIAHDLAEGQRLDEKHLTVQRPGTGIPAAAINLAVGRRVRCAVRSGMMLEWDMLEPAA
ncbi:MAG: N-acetylneuraminate synthase family protein [Phycisphaerales bacterium]|nr:N-acetylneuraminate synthase family protein [Phycisphaerales bacterium]